MKPLLAHPLPPSRRTDRRAFALPLVILLALVAALATAVILQRQGTGYAAVQRQVDLYHKHHRNMGMQEMIDRWVGTIRGPIAERLGAGGLAFELMLPHGDVTRVFLADGQGTVLNDLSAIKGPEAQYTRRTLEILQDRFGDQNPPEGSGGAPLYRDSGPSKISAAGATLEVLEAVAQAVAPESNWQRFVSDLAQRRQEAVLVQSDIRSIALAAGLSQDEAAGLEMMLTADPIVWRVEVETRNTMNPARGRERHGGLIEISREPVSMGQATRFLTWDDLPER